MAVTTATYASSQGSWTDLGPAAPTGWTATHLWVTGLGGTGNVIVAQ